MMDKELAIATPASTQKNLINSDSSNLTCSKTELNEHQQSPTPLSSTSLAGIANKLFSILTQIKKQRAGYQTEKLRAYLLKELEQFSETAKSYGHTEETILISQYIIAKSFDSVINNTSWGQNAQWSQYNLASTLPHAESLNNHFTRALKKMSEMPDLFIDVLELIYIALSLSELNSSLPTHDQELYSLNQELFEIIQNQRGEFERRLSKQKDQHKRAKKRALPPWILLLSLTATIVIIGALYASFSFLTAQSSQTIEQQLSAITQNQGTITSHEQQTQ